MQYVIQVVVNRALNKAYSYLFFEALAPGTRVKISFKHKEEIAYVLNSVLSSEFNDYPLEKLLPILEVFSADLKIPNEILAIIKFASAYYHYPLGLSLFESIPPLLRKNKPLGKLSLAKGRENYAQCQEPLILNSEQQVVVDYIQAKFNTYFPALLFGVTGSGKTEVFLHLMANALLQSLQVLVLVPEINLTPQLAMRFQTRFPNANIILLTSQVADKTRLNNWCQSQSPGVNIVIGTRLAVFTPFYNLGLIIVDEEHDESYKQNDGLRYHARNLALLRAKNASIPILLASATPSLESILNVKNNKLSLFKLKARAISAASLPKIKLINLKQANLNYCGLSHIALDALTECLNRKEMAIVFINRRGYAPVVTCYECGWVATCKSCSSKMVYHHINKKLKCHYCGYTISVPKLCPVCKNQYLHSLGHGTQKLEEFLTTNFPQARIQRVDRDTTYTKKAWQNLYTAIHDEQIDILIGTQMLAKGHDFHNLTLVIGLNMDNALFGVDFRATEVMFNTLTQVSGRAGRGNKPGTVLIQTDYPEHPVYYYLLKHDIEGFINYNLAERNNLSLPPFNYHAIIRLSANSEKSLFKAMEHLKEFRKFKQIKGVRIYPPVPAIVYKLNKKYRANMLFTANERVNLHSALNIITPVLASLTNITVACDVDPQEA